MKRLQDAINSGSNLSVALALREVSRDDLNREMLLHPTLDSDNIVLIDQVVEAGHNIDTPDAFGTTLLMLACQKGYVNVVSHILSLGANVNAKDSNGETPILYAFYNPKDEPQIFQILLRHGADTLVLNRHGLGLLEFCQLFPYSKVRSYLEEYLS